ncbi:hypothetical protein [Sphingobium boeckii]|uniref:Uncharacterized protein n=1 Tax=Sphingobium boeckii TaxID=1082345 RepID=A0A7W9AFL5_9SPHN|nr:hypothetical protein [Sphingobium boeckii]MBB5684772.1 hypothetical protein [Sphingobium boeckii]
MTLAPANRELGFYDKDDDRYYGVEMASTAVETKTDLICKMMVIGGQ